MNNQKDLLSYNGASRRWEGEDAQTRVRLWMDDATFQRHVWASLDAKQIYQPLLGDLEHARLDCRELSYWQSCTDPDVHMVMPDTANKEEKSSNTKEKKVQS